METKLINIRANKEQYWVIGIILTLVLLLTSCVGVKHLSWEAELLDIDPIVIEKGIFSFTDDLVLRTEWSNGRVILLKNFKEVELLKGRSYYIEVSETPYIHWLVWELYEIWEGGEK